MNATKHAEEILRIVGRTKKRLKVKAMNICLNKFFDSVSTELGVNKAFESPDDYYSRLEQAGRAMLVAGDTNDKREFQKQITAMRFLLGVPAPSPSTIAATEEELQ